MQINKYLIPLITILILFYSFNNNFKVIINTNYNKYSNILENRIIELHNKIFNNSKNIDNNENIINNKTMINNKNINTAYFNNMLFKNKYINEVSLIVIFTYVLFLYIYIYNKLYLTIDNIFIYIILISLGFFIINNN